MMIKEIIHNKRVNEFLRFCIVGVLATALHYGLYLGLLYFFPIEQTWWVNLAYSIGYICSFACNMWLTAHFTFHSSLSVQRGVGFMLSHAVNYGLHILFLNMFIWIGISKQWGPILVYCIVIPINFILVRTVFTKLQ